LLDAEVFHSLREAQIVIETGRRMTTPSGHLACSVIGGRPRRCSCLPSPPRQQRFPGQLRQSGPPVVQQPTLNQHSTRITQGGRSVALCHDKLTFNSDAPISLACLRQDLHRISWSDRPKASV
jgi:hypothetical protein